jgi:hypothetical protein
MSMAESEMPTQSLAPELPALGKDGEPCSQCGSPLAADQRYCLECGRRRGGPRVDYRERMAAAPSAERPSPEPTEPGRQQPPAAEPEKPARVERDFAPLAAVGGIAVLGLMLLVGVLIGRGDGDSVPATAPVVLPAGSGAASAETGGATGNGGGDDLSLGGSGDKAKKKNAKVGGGETAAEAGAVTASKDQLEELQSESGEEAAKNALKLPDKIATPGAPPPIDKSKPPGGGEGGAVTIE